MTALMDVLQGAIDIDTNIFLFINGKIGRAHV